MRALTLGEFKPAENLPSPIGRKCTMFRIKSMPLLPNGEFEEMRQKRHLICVQRRRMGLRSLIAEKIASCVLGNGKTRRAVMNELLDQGTLLFRDLGDHAFAFFPTDAIGRSLCETGEFARGSVRDLRVFLKQNNAYRPGMSVLEVGANIGTQTVYFFLDLQCDTVVAIEPDPDNMNLLRHNLALNGLTDKVEILGVAASDTNGTAEFARDLFNRGGSRLGAKRTSGKTRESLSVEIVRIDDLVQSDTLKADQIGLV